MAVLMALLTAVTAAAQARTSVVTGRWQGSTHGTTVGFVVSWVRGTLVLSNLTAHCDDDNPNGAVWDVADDEDNSIRGEAAIDADGVVHNHARPVARDFSGGNVHRRMGRLRGHRGVVNVAGYFTLAEGCASDAQLRHLVVTRHRARELRDGKYTVLGTGETDSFHVYGDGSVLVWDGRFRTPIGGDPDQPELNCADLPESVSGTGWAIFPSPSGSFGSNETAGAYGYVESANVLGKFTSVKAGVGGWNASTVNTVACTGVGALAFRLTRSDPAPVPMHAPGSPAAHRPRRRPAAHTVRYVALGDSYSSGEGVAPYEPGTDTSRDKCRRSTRAYSQRLKLRGVRLQRVSYACSGATTDNVLTARRYQEPAQISHSALEHARLVTITIGGNDAAFGSVITLCSRAVPGHCYQGAARQRITNRLRSLQRQLTETFDKIHATATRARLVVLDYPNLFPPAADSCKKLNRIYSPPARAFIRRLGGELDDEVQAAARSAHAEFVDVRGAFAKHEICSKHEWVNFVVRRGVGVSKASFHPTAAGQAAYARSLARALHGFR